jgi:hypothetical protein
MREHHKASFSCGNIMSNRYWPARCVHMHVGKHWSCKIPLSTWPLSFWVTFCVRCMSQTSTRVQSQTSVADSSVTDTSITDSSVTDIYTSVVRHRHLHECNKKVKQRQTQPVSSIWLAHGWLWHDWMGDSNKRNASLNVYNAYDPRFQSCSFPLN